MCIHYAESENIRCYHCFVCGCCFNKTKNDEMRNVAFKALRYGILAIVSTLAFYFATMIVDSLGHVLQIDSVINSYCIIAVFPWESNNWFRQYVLWWLWLDKNKTETRIRARSATDVDASTNTLPTMQSNNTSSSPTSPNSPNSQIELVLH